MVTNETAMKQQNETVLFREISNLIDAIQVPVLSNRQKEQLTIFLTFMLLENQTHNLTAITNPEEVISYHLLDSLAITSFIDFSTIRGIVDVGTGAGFPGIPLKIIYPDIPLILIEVNKKKIAFLTSVITKLVIEDVMIYPHDWRTFLRKTRFDTDLFVSRASLHPDELLRMFKPSSPYNKSRLVYFASRDWRPLEKEEIYLYDQKTYTIQDKKRVFAFFRAPHQQLDEPKYEDLL
jgi:16S rRNA (guanine(527)-N(7))-methyltransferase RsmG